MGYFEEFERSLQTAADRQAAAPRRRSRRRELAVAAMVAVALLSVALLVAVSRPEHVSASTISVQRTDEGVVVQVIEPTYPPREIFDDLRNAGLDARLELVPTGPSEVDRLVSFTTDGTGARVLPSHAIFVPKGWNGRFVVSGTVLAEAGERYLHPTDGYAKGEALACVGARGARSTDVAAVASRLGLEVTWVDAEGASTTPSTDLVAGKAIGTALRQVRVVLEPSTGAPPVEVDACR
jgi:hypothetical protein